ncbi:Retrotransposon gag domain [Sesbania bispinosa]|nr:Retrotransposon gag domain [Sesbania bispinosa]
MAENDKVIKETKKSQTDGTKKTPSPCHLNSNDNPGNVITQVQLQGENYEEWARPMKISLRARRKWGFIDGTHKQRDEDPPEMEDWWTVQSMLVSWILNVIELTLRSTVTYVENANELWEDIRDRFSVVNGPRIQQLKAELVYCKQQGMTMVAYYGKLKTLWDELANYKQIPRCSCGGCKCDIASKLEKRREGLSKKEGQSWVLQSKQHTGPRVIGYPKWWGDRPRNEGGTSRRNQRHRTSAGRGKWGVARANAAQVVGGSVTNCNNETGKSELPGLSNEQWQILVEMLNNRKTSENEKMTGKHSDSLWIIDTGASNHMTGNLKNLCQQRTICGCPVGLPDEEQVMATKEGTVILDGDRTSRMLIGAGERKDGLYLYHGVRNARAYQTSAENKLDLLHKRMGHSSFKLLKSGGVGLVHDEPDSCEPAPEKEDCTDAMFCHNDEQEKTGTSTASTLQLGRGHRIKQPCVRFRDYVTNTMRRLSSSARSSATSHDSAKIEL